jgi:hypothetical protein
VADIKARIENDFTYHPPKEGQPEKYNVLRGAHKQLALLIIELTPAGREQSLALTNLEQSMMFSNAAIARGE